jgi:hypothetical protein
MIPKSWYGFSEKIMLKQQAKAKWRFKVIFALGGGFVLDRADDRREYGPASATRDHL